MTTTTLLLVLVSVAVALALPYPEDLQQYELPLQQQQQQYRAQLHEPQGHAPREQQGYEPQERANLYKPDPYKEKFPPKPYTFDYGVRDDYSGAHYGHSETSNGNSVEGSYQVALPDGRIQIVKYVADHKNGFQAQVEYEGEARYPEVDPHQDPYKAPHKPTPYKAQPAPHKPRPAPYKPQPHYKSVPQEFQHHEPEPAQHYAETVDHAPVYLPEEV